MLTSDSGTLVGNPYELVVASASSTSCVLDRLEPNDDALSPRDIIPGRFDGLTSCPENNDFF